MIMPLELKKMTAASPDQHAIYDGGLAKARLGYSPRVAQLGGQGTHTGRVGGYSPRVAQLAEQGTNAARVGEDSPCVAQLGGQGAHTARVGGYIPWFAQLGGQGTHITSVRLNSLCKSRTLALIYAQLC